MHQIAIETIGWIGALLILIAYGLLMLHRITVNSSSYQWMNLIGALTLIVNCAWNGALPSVFLNVIWLGIAIYALVRKNARVTPT
jgi:hypothetical protein